MGCKSEGLFFFEGPLRAMFRGAMLGWGSGPCMQQAGMPPNPFVVIPFPLSMGSPQHT